MRSHCGFGCDRYQCYDRHTNTMRLLFISVVRLLVVHHIIVSITLPVVAYTTTTTINIPRLKPQSHPTITTNIMNMKPLRTRQHFWSIVPKQQQQQPRFKMIMNDIDEGDDRDTDTNRIGTREIVIDDPSITSPGASVTTNMPNIQYIGMMEDWIQQATFVTAFVLLGVGTQLCIQLWYSVGIDIVGADYFYSIQTKLFPMAFGAIFALVGIAHFVFVENFARIVPPYNCWGQLWKVPAPFHRQMNVSYEEYHSYWSGIVECVGGIWLFYSGIVPSLSSTVPATILFALTIGVTPANLFMFTHNASPGGIVPPLQYPFGHIARFVIQCGLLSNFYIMMHPIQ